MGILGLASRGARLPANPLSPLGMAVWRESGDPRVQVGNRAQGRLQVSLWQHFLQTGPALGQHLLGAQGQAPQKQAVSLRIAPSTQSGPQTGKTGIHPTRMGKWSSSGCLCPATILASHWAPTWGRVTAEWNPTTGMQGIVKLLQAGLSPRLLGLHTPSSRQAQGWWSSPQDSSSQASRPLGWALVLGPHSGEENPAMRALNTKQARLALPAWQNHISQHLFHSAACLLLIMR